MYSISNISSNRNILKDSFIRVYMITKLIPKGKVLTYKKLGILAMVNNPRVVGSILHKNPDQENTPCHRVVNSQGKVATTFAFGGEDSQRELLENEGIVFVKNKINMKKYLWQPNNLEIHKMQQTLPYNNIKKNSKDNFDQNCLISTIDKNNKV